jgi:uncharacterized membrane protein YdjX (TVP38/TMEM64 family)
MLFIQKQGVYGILKTMFLNLLIHDFHSLEIFLKTLDPLSASFYLILAKILGCLLMLPATPLTILSGVILGPYYGALVSVIGNTIGATFAFLLGRYFLQGFVKKYFLSKYPSINKYEEKLFKDGFLTVLFLRLVPLFPFNILNYVLALTEVKLKDYVLATMIGIIPGTIAYTLLAESLVMINYFEILIAIILIIFLILLSRVWKM